MKAQSVNHPHSPTPVGGQCTCESGDALLHYDHCETLHQWAGHDCDPRTCRFSEAETCPHGVDVARECGACEALPTWQQLGLDPVVVRLTDLLSEVDGIHVVDTPGGLALHRATVADLAHRIASDRQLAACYAKRVDGSAA